VNGPRWPARYELRVDRVLDDRWADWFGGLQVTSDGTQTVIAGLLPDQPALLGVLAKIRDLGLCLISYADSTPVTPETGRGNDIRSGPCSQSPPSIRAAQLTEEIMPERQAPVSAQPGQAAGDAARGAGEGRGSPAAAPSALPGSIPEPKAAA